jgi:hypothetical protein
MPNLTLNKFSVGTGDRFARQAKAQLQACAQALQSGVEVVPVWNKSNREHNIIGSEPTSARQAADAAVKALDWKLPYFLDADHITLETVGRFLDPCDFFTIDVADFIGQTPVDADVDAFVRCHPELLGSIQLAGVDEAFEITQQDLREAAQKFLAAVKKAGEVYRKVLSVKGAGNFIPEVSMDETDRAQSPVELLIILAAIADEGIPVQTIAPKFSGRFNKGVDYVGDTSPSSTARMALDIAAIATPSSNSACPPISSSASTPAATSSPSTPPFTRTSSAFSTGVHLKTAGTTWLEEIIGLAEAGGDGWRWPRRSTPRPSPTREELCAPYATVIDIDTAKLPAPAEVAGWTSEQYTSALRHDPARPAYNSSLRQLLHVGFKVAAKMGRRYLDLLEANEPVIAKNVTENLYDRHIAPVFLGRSKPSSQLFTPGQIPGAPSSARFCSCGLGWDCEKFVSHGHPQHQGKKSNGEVMTTQSTQP